jgi:hypothetical protein
MHCRSSFGAKPGKAVRATHLLRISSMLANESADGLLPAAGRPVRCEFAVGQCCGQTVFINKDALFSWPTANNPL